MSYIRNADGSQGESWQPTTGCGNHKRGPDGGPASEGCRTCWAGPVVRERLAGRMKGLPGCVGAAVGCGGIDAFAPALHPYRLDQPLHWTKPRTVFTSHLGDWLDPDLREDEWLRHEEPFEYAAAMLGVMAVASQHTFLTLTKQADRLDALMAWLDTRESGNGGPFFACACEAAWYVPENPPHRFQEELLGEGDGPWPLSNVWLGVSVCDASELPKLEVLRRLSAAGWHVWASFEPLLSDLPGLDLTGIRWCAVGADNAPLARRRPMDLAWVRRIRDEARRTGCGFYFKQEYQGSLPGVLVREPGLDGQDCNVLPWYPRRGR